jgi:hypothetical protein
MGETGTAPSGGEKRGIKLRVLGVKSFIEVSIGKFLPRSNTAVNVIDGRNLL